jgi:hypothetical protein
LDVCSGFLREKKSSPVFTLSPFSDLHRANLSLVFRNMAVSSVADPDPPYSYRMFLGLLDPDPDPLVRGMDPDPVPEPNLDPFITKQKM